MNRHNHPSELTLTHTEYSVLVPMGSEEITNPP